jgi:hypothetical protein
MTVFAKLQAARLEIAKMPLKKSGKNAFAKYEYFELGDFIPAAHGIFNHFGLCGVFNISYETATLCIHDTETGEVVKFSSPTVMAENAKGQAIQSMGSTHTYFRRYLWLMALELTENDVVDASEPAPRPAPKEDQQIVKSSVDPKTGEIKPPAKIEGKGGEWNIKITAKEGATAEQWSETVFDSAMICLRAAKTVDDVMTIFRVNRAIFDRLRADDEPIYTSLMNEFKLAKESFNAIP